MLRKRASFKPNLNQVRQETNPKPATDPPAPLVRSTAPAIPTTSTDTTTQSNPSPSVASTTTPIHSTPPAPAKLPLVIPPVPTNDSAPQDVTRLTSLRNSAYKNVKLKDLLFFNPPLTRDQKRHKKNERRRSNEEQFEKDDINQVVEAEPDEPTLVPKVKLGPDGQLVLDESSTLIRRKNSIKSQEAIVEDNEEIISRTNYDSYRRKPASSTQTKWSIEDTQKFYHALSILGTDFSMMESLLFSGHRSRTELHKKFKREERINKAKIDVALSKRISLNSEELDGLKDIIYKC